MDISVYVLGCLTASGLLTWISRKPLRMPGSHGFYRFFAWQGILTLFALHHPYFESAYLRAQPVLAFFVFCCSVILVAAGWWGLVRVGRPSAERNDKTLFKFEKTTVLVDSGIFGIIRHPMYASLLLLAWGAFFQRPTPFGIPVLLLTSLFLALTARADESECLAYFGAAYADYKERTWALIPWLY